MKAIITTSIISALLLTSIACQKPFPADRHDLVDDRVAAITLTANEARTQVQPQVWLVVDGRLWSDESVALAWSWLDPTMDALEAVQLAEQDPKVVATGPAPWLIRPHPLGDDLLMLQATFPSGTTRTATVRLTGPGPAQLAPIRALQLAVLEGPKVSESTEDDLPVDVRAARTATRTDALVADRWMRLQPEFDGDATAVQTFRWLATGGTFLELTRTTTDWAPADLTLDGLEIDALLPSLAGYVTFMGLALDGKGGQQVAVRDTWLGPPRTPGVYIAQRWMPTDVDVADNDYVQGTLELHDDSPTGMRWVGAVDLAAEDLPELDPFGTAAIPCAPDAGPFDPNWLLRGLCTRIDLVGHTVVGARP